MAALITSAATGNFGAGATWVGGVAPAADDWIFVSAGDTVTLDGETFAITAKPGGFGLEVEGAGTLTVAAGGGLTFASDALILINGTLDIDVAVVLGGDWTSGSGDTVTCSGNIELAADSVWSSFAANLTFDGAGASTFTTNAATGPPVKINAAGSLTAQDAATLAKFELAAGTYADGGFAHNVGGAIVISAGTFTNTGVWTMTASGNLSSPNWGSRFANLVIADGAKATKTGNIYFKKITIGTGVGGVAIDDAGAHNLYGYPEANNFWVQPEGAGTVTPGGTASNFRIYSDLSNGRIEFNGQLLFAGDILDRIYTMTGDIDVGAHRLTIYANTVTKKTTLDMNGYELTCGVLALGLSGADDRSGVLDCGEGIVKVASLVSGHAANLNNAINFGSAYVQCSGILNCDNIAHTSTADNLVHIEGLGTGQIDNCDPATIVHAHNMIDGGTNNAVNGLLTFDEHAPPGSMAMMGCGI